MCAAARTLKQEPQAPWPWRATRKRARDTYRSDSQSKAIGEIKQVIGAVSGEFLAIPQDDDSGVARVHRNVGPVE